MKKKVLSVLLLVMMVTVFITGCKGNQKEPDSRETADGGSKEAEDTKAPAKDAVTIEAWMFGGLSAEVTVWKELADEFNAAQSEVYVNMVSQEWGSRNEKIVTAYSGDSAPDIYVLGPVIDEYGKRLGIISPIEEMYPDLAKKVKESILPAVAEKVASRDGVLWTIPSWCDLSPYMCYNKEALKAIGLDENSVPKTWSEFESAAIAMTKAGYIGYSIPMSQSNYADMNNEFNYWNWQLGGAPISDDLTKITLTDKAAVTTMTFLKDMYDAGTFSENAESMTYMDRHELFFGGKAATNIGYTYLPGIITDLEVSDDFEYVMANMPVPDEGTIVNADKSITKMISSNQEVCVSSKTEKADAVGKFLEWLVDNNYWHRWVTEVGARTSISIASYEDESLRAETEKLWPDLVKQYDEGILTANTNTKPSYGGITEVETTMSQGLVNIITGKYPSIEEGLKTVNDECQKILDEYNASANSGK